MESFKNIFARLQIFHKPNQRWTDDKIWNLECAGEKVGKKSC